MSMKRSVFSAACRVTAVGLALGTTSPLQSSSFLSPSMAMPRSLYVALWARSQVELSFPVTAFSCTDVRKYGKTSGPLRPRAYTPHGMPGLMVVPWCLVPTPVW